MKLKIPLIIATTAFFLLINNICLFSSQEAYSVKMKNGESFVVALNKSVTIKNIWNKGTLKEWEIIVKVLRLTKEGVQVEIKSPTFLGKDYNTATFIKIGETVNIIQSEEISTKIWLKELAEEKAVFCIKILSSSPAPTVSSLFDVDYKD